MPESPLMGESNSRIIRQTDHPEHLLEERNRARSVLAKILHLTYDEDMPDRLADRIRSLVVAGAANKRPK